MSSAHPSAAEQSSASPSPSTSEPPPKGGSTSSNLYLVTFLATLFLLLFVSCAIILRSYILRRRFQRRLDEAMAAGILLAPRSQGSRKKRFGAKPKFFDAYLADGGERWDQMRPLAAQPILVKRKYREPKPVPPPADPPAPSVLPVPVPSDQAAAIAQTITTATTPTPPVISPLPCQPAAFSARRVAHSLLHRIPGVRSRLRLNDPDTPPPPAATTPTRIRTEMLQVAVLIAMPSPNKSTDSSYYEKGNEDEEEELPEVVIGVSRWTNYKPQPVLSEDAIAAVEVVHHRQRVHEAEFARRIAGSL